MSNDKSVEQETRAPMLRVADIRELMDADEDLKVSIYVPTTPVSNYSEENRILFKDQVKQVSHALEERGTDKRLAQELVDKLETIGTNDQFWMHQQFGLAVFATQSRMLVRRMTHGPEQAQTTVADSFHLRPALFDLSSWMRYQVLCVGMEDVALYNGKGENLTQVELHSDVPSSMADALGKTLHATEGDNDQRAGEESSEQKRYFKAVDEAIRDKHNGRTNLPLILATLPEYQGLYREVSDNPNLVENGLDKDPFEIAHTRQLGQEAWEVASQELQGRVQTWVEEYQQRQAHGEGVSQVDQVAQAAVIGQIETLLVDENASAKGKMDAETGKVKLDDSEDAVADDVIDNIVEQVLRTEGQLRFIPAERMPSNTGVAAILRYSTDG